MHHHLGAFIAVFIGVATAIVMAAVASIIAMRNRNDTDA